MRTRKFQRDLTSHQRRQQLIDILAMGAVYMPAAVCWLSKSVGYPVARALAKAWNAGVELKFGQTTSVTVLQKRVRLLATMWPGRGHERVAAEHIAGLV